MIGLGLSINRRALASSSGLPGNTYLQPGSVFTYLTPTGGYYLQP